MYLFTWRGTIITLLQFFCLLCIGFNTILIKLYYYYYYYYYYYGQLPSHN